MQMPSVASTLIAMTNLSPSESAAFLKNLRDQTNNIVKQGVETKELNPYQFQSALSQTFGTEALGIVDPMGIIDYTKLDILMGGSADIERQNTAFDMNSLFYKEDKNYDIFDALFNTKSSLFNLTA